MTQFFPYMPDYSTWDDWNGNLAIYYSAEPITFSSENNWKDTAANLASLPTFAKYPVPDPYDFSDWQGWARQFISVVSAPVR